MKSQRRSEITIGLLFLMATASYMIGSGLIESELQGTNAILDTNKVRIGVFLEFINSAAVVGIAALIFPILKKYSEGLTLIYFSSRIIESILLLISAIGPIILITLNEGKLQQFQSLISLFAHYSFQIAMVSLSIGSIFLCYILFKDKLLPRVLAVLGLIGYLFLLVSGVLAIMDYEDIFNLYIPGALFEIIFPIWLMIKGFRVSK